MTLSLLEAKLEQKNKGLNEAITEIQFLNLCIEELTERRNAALSKKSDIWWEIQDLEEAIKDYKEQ